MEFKPRRTTTASLKISDVIKNESEEKVTIDGTISNGESIMWKISVHNQEVVSRI